MQRACRDIEKLRAKHFGDSREYVALAELGHATVKMPDANRNFELCGHA